VAGSVPWRTSLFEETPIPFKRNIFDRDTAAPAEPGIDSPQASAAPVGGARRGPLEGPDALGRAAPFLTAAALALLLTDLLHSDDAGPALFEASAFFAVGVVLALATPWNRLPAWTQAIPPLAFLVLVALVREAEGGAGATSTPMLALPVIWFALYGNRIELAISAVGAGLVIALPVAIGGADAGYPDSELRAAATWLGVLGIGGYAISTLVRQRELLLADVAALARTDPLTGLANRRGWQELLRREIARAERNDGSFSVALVDLDRFKDFNDRNGHAAGDRLLKEAAARWSGQIRDMDLIARYGGEEFALLLPGAGFADAAAVIERIRSHTPTGITVSGGIAEWDGSEDPDALLARADGALYDAKRNGRDRVHLAPTPEA
jgi:diguanylate cyclase (GGDEF)-like protein